MAPNIYAKYLHIDKKGQYVLYVRLQKALYSIIKASLLFYRKLVTDLQSHGFKLNEYDPCVANKDINGHQLTAIWHVDDMMIAHHEELEVSKMIQWLKSKYECTIGTMTVSRGNTHDFLGMSFNFQKFLQSYTMLLGCTFFILRFVN